MSDVLSFVVNSTDSTVPLKLSVWVNDQCCFGPTLIDKETVFRHEISDDEDLEYRIKIELSGKIDEYTKLDEQGNIVKDALLEFKDFEIMGINIDTFMTSKIKYHHDFNGHGPATEQQFGMSMGCNGTLEFTFTTPLYMWLLENM